MEKHMIVFKDNFFEGEERYDFYIEPMIKSCWAAELEMLQKIDSICRENEIRYFADWGTLLGAVRHNGFIPWDDDMDICMLRPDYMKFLSVIGNYSSDLTCYNIYNTDEWGQHATRVVNHSGFKIERDILKEYHGCPYAVGLDIFPVDYVPRDKMLEEEQKETIKLIKMAYNLKVKQKEISVLSEEYAEVLKGYRESLQMIQDICHITFSEENPSEQELLILLDEVNGLYGENDADYVTAMHRLVNGQDYYVKKESYADVIMHPFETIEIPIPIGYDEILTFKYGKYMEMRNVGGGHNYPFYKPLLEGLCRLNQHKNIEETKLFVEEVCRKYYIDFRNKSCEPKQKYEESELLSEKDHRNAAIAEVLGEVKRICTQHHLSLFALEETLDDLLSGKEIVAEMNNIKFGMFREEYMDFIRIVQRELNAWFDYKSIYSHDTYDGLDLFIHTDGYLCEDEEYKERFHGCESMVGIRIFPLDRIPADETKAELQRNLLKELRMTKRVLPAEPPYTTEMIEIVERWEEVIGINVNHYGRMSHEIGKLIDAVCGLYSAGASKEISALVSENCKTYPIEWFEDKEEIPLHKTTITVPAGCLK